MIISSILTSLAFVDQRQHSAENLHHTATPDLFYTMGNHIVTSRFYV